MQLMHTNTGLGSRKTAHHHHQQQHYLVPSTHQVKSTNVKACSINSDRSALPLITASSSSSILARVVALAAATTAAAAATTKQQQRSSFRHVAAAAAGVRHVAAAAAAAAAQPTSTDGLRSAAIALAKVADDTKALDISLLHVEPIVSWTSYMLLCTVMSKPQLLAVLSRMEDAAAEFGLEKQNSAGSSQWEVLDFGSIVVHVFTAEQREHYNLDDFYALAQEVELPFVSDTASATGSLYQPSSSSEQWSKSL